jgi:multidrug efflux pump subunit AcrA (membrane-fusion protein)
MLIKNITLISFLSAVFISTNAFAQTKSDSVITVPGVPVGATVSLGGTVVPIKDVTFSAQIPGRIESIAGEEGDLFEEGVELIAINTDDLLAKRRAAWANLANAEAALRNAGVQYSREWISPYGSEQNDAMGGMGSMMKSFTNPMQGMFGTGSSPGYDRYAQRYQYGTQVEQARSSLAAARASIEEIDTKIRDSKSVAPFKGVITKKLVEVGDPVQPGQPLLEFADMSQLQIKVEVPARLMPGVKKGMVFPARLDVGDVDIQARVVQIFPIADPDRHTVTVKMELPPGAPGGAGMYAEVLITDVNAKVRELPVVPKNSLVWRGSLPGVYVMNEQNKRELRLVRTGDEVGLDGISILSGLRIGERVIVKGAEAEESSSGGNSWN